MSDNPERGADATALVAGRRAVLELLRSGGTPERVLIADGAGSSAVLAEIRRRAQEASIPTRDVPRREIERVAGDLSHQGVVALAARFRYAPLGELLRMPRALILFLDGVTDPHNLGSLLRSADGAGWQGVVVPGRRSAAVTATVRKVSAGAAEVVPVARVTNLARALDEAKQAGLWVVGLDQDAADDLWASDLMEAPLALVLGAEGRGMSRNVRDHCDALVSIPSGGRLESLNVAVAGALAMFEVARRRSASATL